MKNADRKKAWYNENMMKKKKPMDVQNAFNAMLDNMVMEKHYGLMIRDMLHVRDSIEDFVIMHGTELLGKPKGIFNANNLGKKKGGK